MKIRASKWAHWAGWAALVILGLAAALVVAEEAARCFGPPGLHMGNRSWEYDSNPDGYFDCLGMHDGRMKYGIRIHCPREAATGRPMGRVPDEILAAGKDAVREFYARPANILLLGDSFTMGQGVRYEDTYARCLERGLSSMGCTGIVRNAAVWGYGIEDVVRTYEQESATRRYPLVIYGLVLNDFGLPGGERITGSDFIDFNNGRAEPASWRNKSALLALLNVRKRGAATMQCYRDAFLGPQAQDKFALLHQLARDVEADGGELLVVLFPLLYEFESYPFRAIHARIASFCTEEGIQCLDLLPAFSSRCARELWVHPTDHHPNREAHAIAADRILGRLANEDGCVRLAVNSLDPEAP